MGGLGMMKGISYSPEAIQKAFENEELKFKRRWGVEIICMEMRDEVLRKEHLEREELVKNFGVYLESWRWKRVQRKIYQKVGG